MYLNLNNVSKSSFFLLICFHGGYPPFIPPLIEQEVRLSADHKVQISHRRHKAIIETIPFPCVIALRIGSVMSTTDIATMIGDGEQVIIQVVLCNNALY